MTQLGSPRHGAVVRRGHRRVSSTRRTSCSRRSTPRPGTADRTAGRCPNAPGVGGEKTGVWFDRWFVKLVSATESRVPSRPTAAPDRHRFACSTAWPRSVPPTRRRRARGRQPAAQADRPGDRIALPAGRATVKADGDVARLRDVSGTHYAVISTRKKWALPQSLTRNSLIPAQGRPRARHGRWRSPRHTRGNAIRCGPELGPYRGAFDIDIRLPEAQAEPGRGRGTAARRSRGAAG